MKRPRVVPALPRPGSPLRGPAALLAAAFLASGAAAQDPGDPPEPNGVSVIATRDSTREQDPRLRAPLVPGIFTISRSGPTDHALPVYYTLTGSAENGIDYEKLPGEITIPAGERTADLLVVAIDDNFAEPPESVVLTLQDPMCIAIFPPPPECYRVGTPRVAAVTLFDNDLKSSPPYCHIAAPESGATFDRPAAIRVAAAVVDPDGWVPLVEFFANDRKIGEQSVNFLVPPPPGQRQLFEFMWQEVPAGIHRLTVVATDQLGNRSTSDPVPIWVRDCPDVPTVAIHAVDPFASEASTRPGGDPARFKVLRDCSDLSLPLEVSYDVSGTATPGGDYERLSGRITIPADRRAAILTVVPIADDPPEGRETVIVSLFQPLDVEPPPYRVGTPGRAAAVITDRDYPHPRCDVLRDRLVHICRRADPGSAFQVEVTEDMLEWRVVDSLTAGPDGLHYLDADPEVRASRFYRFVPVPFDPVGLDE